MTFKNQMRIEEEKQIREFKDWMHAHPELSNGEYEVTRRIGDIMAALPGVEILDLPVDTGIVARLSGRGDGPTIGLRCDIDAIPQTEEWESPHCSTVPGVMHACGHDFHTAALLGAALVLSRRRTELSGDDIFLFQRAEETTTGAQSMLEAGLLEQTRPDYFFGLHNWPGVPAGKVIVKEGALMAAKVNFVITVTGRGGHGSMPHLCVDPIVCAAAMVQGLQTIVSRNTDPMDHLICSVNAIQGGSMDNLVVDQVQMAATIRSLSAPAMARARSRVEAIVASTAAAYECTAEIQYKEDIPLADNSPEMTALARKAARSVVDEADIVSVTPTLASEDFAMIMARVPSFLFWFGSGALDGNCPALHHPRFHTNDDALAVAASVLVQAALTAQKEK
ncbi:MAG: M20 family metallopeptidase [Eubacterium sp.]